MSEPTKPCPVCGHLMTVEPKEGVYVVKDGVVTDELVKVWRCTCSHEEVYLTQADYQKLHGES